MRSGDEPAHARSALRMRLVLAVCAALFCAGSAIWFTALDRPSTALLFVGVAILATANAVVVGRRLRQGPHFQPGRGIPAYRPVESGDPGRRCPDPARARPTERQRVHRYLVLMGICLTLIALAWTVVRAVSVTAAEVLTVVAMVIPPLAVVVANAGWSRNGPGPPR